MRVTISAPTIDALGSISISVLPRSKFGATERRLTRVRTLDGGYALNDYGHAESDRDIQLYWDADRSTNYVVDYLVRNYGELLLSCEQGFYRCAPRSLETKDNRTQLTLLVLDQIAT